MTEQEVIEGNILIAEFMDKQDVLGTVDTEPFVTNVYFDASQIRQRMDQGINVKLYYHSSWDLLMPVIDDIYYSRRFDTGAQTSEISSKTYRLYKNIEAALLHLSISQTHEAVIQFIQWYNTQTPKS